MKAAKKLTLALAVTALLGISDRLAAAHSHGNRFGSIAYSQGSGRFGSSWSSGDQFDAVEQALASCNRGDCRTLLWFRNSCGALARARNGAIVWAPARRWSTPNGTRRINAPASGAAAN